MIKSIIRLSNAEKLTKIPEFFVNKKANTRVVKIKKRQYTRSTIKVLAEIYYKSVVLRTDLWKSPRKSWLVGNR